MLLNLYIKINAFEISAIASLILLVVVPYIGQSSLYNSGPSKQQHLSYKLVYLLLRGFLLYFFLYIIN